MVRSNKGEKTREVMVVAALISVHSQLVLQTVTSGTYQRTTFAGDQLTNFPVRGTMRVWVQGRQARDGDVPCEQIEFGDPVPDVGFRRELDDP